MDRDTSRDVTYVPRSATTGAILLYVVGVCILAAVSWLRTGEPLPWRVHGSGLAFLATALLVLAPTFPVLHTGWSYLLTPEELAVRRFGKERFRVPLSSYLETTSPMGLLRLVFRDRSVFILDGHSDDRQRFAILVRRYAEERLGTRALPERDHGPRVVETTVERVRPGATCLACGGPAEQVAKLCVQRGMDLILWAHLEYSHVPVSLCREHARRQQRWQRAVWLGYPALALLLALVVWLPSESAVFSGCLMLGSVGAVFLFRPVHTTLWGRIRDWASLGARSTRLSTDLQTATFRFKTEEIAARFEVR